MLASSTILLDQLADVLEKITAQSYALPLDVLNGASIGEHIRHTLEFYDCLCSQMGTGVVNYDLRARDHVMEISLQTAKHRINLIKNRLQQLRPEQALILEVNYDPKGLTSERIPTSVAREISYVIEHTVHHMALLKIGLKALETPVYVPDSFGLAVSTLRYRKSLQPEQS